MKVYEGYDEETFNSADEFIEYLEDYISMLFDIFDGPYDIQEMIENYKKD